jgi:hypothetical protein
MQNIKFDPAAWIEATAGNSVPCGRNVHVRLALPGTIEVDLGKGYRTVAHGTEMKIALPKGGRIRSPNSDITVYAGYKVDVEVEEAPFTNFDKRSNSSSVERMIMQSTREAELQRIAAKQKRARADFARMEKLKEKGVVQDHDVADPDAPPPPPDVAPGQPAPVPGTPAGKAGENAATSSTGE